MAMACGCSKSLVSKQNQSLQHEATAIVSLNKQIEEFNEDRKLTPNMGIFPIDSRVSRIEHDPKSKQITTFDKDNTPFIILRKEPDGRFKGVIEQKYHDLVGSGPDRSHSWGHVIAEFYLEKGMF